MEVDSQESSTAGAAGSFSFNASGPGASPDFPSTAAPQNADAAVQGDAHHDRFNANAASAAAKHRDSANNEHELTLEEVIEDLVAPDFIPARWCFLVNPDQGGRIDMTPAEFAKEMLEYFDPEFLITSGLFERIGEDVQLVASLKGDAPLLVKIDKSAHTITFTREDEPLLPEGHTALQCGLQRKPDASTDPTKTLWVAASLEAVEILKRLKLPAVLSDGLETMRKQEIDKLFAGNHRTDADWQYDLVLVDFDIANLANRPGAAMGDIVKRLATAASVYGIDPSRRFTMLRPIRSEFELLEQAADFEDSDRVRQLLVTWAEAAKGTRFDSGFAYDRREAPSFSAARQTLGRVLQSNTPLPSSVADAQKAYSAAGRDPVVQKFYQLFEQSNDPFVRLHLLAAARLADI